MNTQMKHAQSKKMAAYGAIITNKNKLSRNVVTMVTKSRKDMPKYGM